MTEKAIYDIETYKRVEETRLDYKDKVLSRLQKMLDYHTYISLEFKNDSFLILLENRFPNMLGNFAGGDMAYAANMAAGLKCIAEDKIAQTASINIECIARGDGDLLVAEAHIVHSGSKLIRTRCEVFTRNNGEDSLVAIAQVNMSPLANQEHYENLLNE